MSDTPEITETPEVSTEPNDNTQEVLKETTLKQSMNSTAKLLILVVIVILTVLVVMMCLQENMEQKNIVDLPNMPELFMKNWGTVDGSGNVVTFTYNTLPVPEGLKSLFKAKASGRADNLSSMLVMYANYMKLISSDGKTVKLNDVLRDALRITDRRKEVSINVIRDVANNNILMVVKMPGGGVESVPLKLKSAKLNTANKNINVQFQKVSDNKILRFRLIGRTLHTVGVDCPTTRPGCLKPFANLA